MDEGAYIIENGILKTWIKPSDELTSKSVNKVWRERILIEKGSAIPWREIPWILSRSSKEDVTKLWWRE